MGIGSGGLTKRLYVAFLLVAVIPTAIAGVIGIYFSLEVLKEETLHHLSLEVKSRANGVTRYFEQIGAELNFLAHSPAVKELPTSPQSSMTMPRPPAIQGLEQEWLTLAASYPHLDQIRFIDHTGREVVRVEHRQEGTRIVPIGQLQDKSDRYYFKQTMALKPGQIFVSPLDLNVEHGQVESPEQPMIRLATPVAGPDGLTAGILVINLRADVLLAELEQMVEARAAVAYLFDRSGHYLSRSADRGHGLFTSQPMNGLTTVFGKQVLQRLLTMPSGTQRTDGWILAHSEVALFPNGADKQSKWVIALAYPEWELLRSILNLYVLYAVLAVALAVTALAGYIISRRLLDPLEALSRETEAIAAGDFSRRVAVRGHDEIAGLGRKFNAMVERLSQLVQSLHEHRSHLEEQVRARTQDLERRRAQLAAVFDHTVEGIIAADADGTVLLANDAATRALGLDQSAVGLGLNHLLPDWDAFAREASRLPEARHDVAWNDRILALSVTRIRESEDGSLGSFIVVIRDVSEERHLQDERRELDRQMFQMEKMATLGELAMSLAHEIGNPLAGMKAVAQAIQYEEDLPAGIGEAVGRLEAETDRLANFLRTFHGFAAPRPMYPEPCDLLTLVEDVLFWVRKDAQSKHIMVVVDIPPHLPTVLADPHQMKQVLLNLFVNAVHAMPDGGSLTITARYDGAGIVTEVRDTGCGIAASLLPFIFNPFFTTRPGGSGLGLAIVAKIVREHGAEIRIESEAGCGTCFTLHWPVAHIGEAHA